MIYLLAFLLLFVLFVLALVVGFGVASDCGILPCKFSFVYNIGMLSILFAFIAISIFGALFDISLKNVGVSWLTVMLLYIVYLLIFRRRKMISHFRNCLKSDFKSYDMKTKMLAIASLMLILTQIIVCISCQFNQPDVIRYVSKATLAYETGRLSVSSPVMMFYAWLSLVFNVHPMTMIFSMIPAVMIPLYYSVFYQVISYIIRDDELKVYFAMLVFGLLSTFGYQSSYLTELVMLFSYFSGICLFVYAVLPEAMYFMMVYADNHVPKSNKPLSKGTIDNSNLDNINEDSLSDEEWEELDMKKHKIINARNVAIVLFVVVIIMAAAIYILNRKINSIYNLSVQLEEQLNDSSNIQEFIPEGSNETAAYIIRQNHSALNIIGGGDISYADQLSNYIKSNGNTVKEWYLYSDRPEDTKGYEYCLSQGIDVINVYYLGVEKKVD